MTTRFNTPGRYMEIASSVPTYVHFNNYGINGQPPLGVGTIHFNPSSQRMEVYNGSSWISLDDDYATIKLSSEAEVILDWARTKMQEEWEVQTLAKEHAAVQLALDNLNKAKQQLAVTVILSKEDSK